jgi:hypothetical protein
MKALISKPRAHHPLFVPLNAPLLGQDPSPDSQEPRSDFPSSSLRIPWVNSSLPKARAHERDSLNFLRFSKFPASHRYLLVTPSSTTSLSCTLYSSQGLSLSKANTLSSCQCRYEYTTQRSQSASFFGPKGFAF